MAGLTKDYQKFMTAFLAAQPPSVKKEEQHRRGQEAWKKVKLDLKDDPQAISKKISQFKVEAVNLKSKSMSHFAKCWNNFQLPRQKEKNTSDEVEVLVSENSESDTNASAKEVPALSSQEGSSDHQNSKIQRERPAQQKAQAELSSVESKLATYHQLKNSGFATIDPKEASKLGTERDNLKRKLKRLGAENERQKKRNADRQKAIKELCSKDPEAAERFKSHNRGHTGRPRLEEDQPGLLSAILNIVQSVSAADDRRRCEALRSVKTLDDLVSELEKMNHTISRSATYLRLLPRRGNTSEGKRHVQTVPVKLLRPENSLRKKNPDRGYAMSFVNDIQQLEELFGPDQILFLSNDDKARVPIGLAAATLQSPLLMHLEWAVRLPDHDFVVGPRHKLTPSVIAVCNLKENGSLSYSGETYIFVRSGKHDTSNAYTHGYDLKELFTSGALQKKPILLLETDGAQDEAPRYPKPMEVAIRLFKLLELDVLIHAVNASGLSAFNPCERRMAPLSHDISGVVLPHDTFGSHLNSKQETIDIDLEKKNFYAAADVLSEIWSNTVINNFKVHCKTVKEGHALEPEEVDQEWVARHVQQLRYSLQIVKCGKANCCKPFATDWMRVFPQRFLPPPAVYKFGPRGLQPVEPEEYIKDPNKKYKFASLKERLLLQLKPNAASKYIRPPFDIYCPSMQEKLAKSICKVCGSSWPCPAAMKRHAVCHKNTFKRRGTPKPEFMPQQIIEDELSSEDELERPTPADDNSPMPVFSIQDHVTSCFQELANEPSDEFMDTE